jgi:hypothetical protein
MIISYILFFGQTDVLISSIRVSDWLAMFCI